MTFAADDENPLMNDYWVPIGLMPMSGTSIDDAALDAAAKLLEIDDYRPTT